VITTLSKKYKDIDFFGDIIDKKFPFEPDNPATAYTNIVDSKGIEIGRAHV
jgi:hypothetical protein